MGRRAAEMLMQTVREDRITAEGARLATELRPRGTPGPLKGG